MRIRAEEAKEKMEDCLEEVERATKENNELKDTNEKSSTHLTAL